MLLIVFVKNSIPGKVKTRIAKDIGDEKAMELYNILKAHTADISAQADADKWVFYADYIENNDFFNESLFDKKLQADAEFGMRMQTAFDEGFAVGHDKIVLICSDCYELNSDHIREAFRLLDHKEAVLGPAFDGGYYLIGLRKMYSVLFDEKSWSTNSVLSDTIEDLNSLEISYDMLEPLSDIDLAADIPNDLRTKLNI
jgi:rSAM/selenodomain-associated transferase 1